MNEFQWGRFADGKTWCERYGRKAANGYKKMVRNLTVDVKIPGEHSIKYYKMLKYVSLFCIEEYKKEGALI